MAFLILKGSFVPTPFHRLKRSLGAAAGVALLALALACGGNGPANPGDRVGTTNAKVTLSPVTANVTTGHSLQFTASSPWGGGAAYAVLPATAGIVDASGNFTASATPGTCTIVAMWDKDVRYTASATVTTVPIPTAPTITAPAHLVANQAGYIASVPVQVGCTYAWSITGGTITTVPTLATITFTAGATGTVALTCQVLDAAGDAASAPVASAPIDNNPPVLPIVTAPATVTGSLPGYTASVPPQTGCSYAWTIGNGTLTAGSGSTTITFTPAASGAVTFSVVVTDAMGSVSTAGTGASAIVAAPVASITVPAQVTGGLPGYAASVPPQTGCSYAWTIGNGTLTVGAGTNTITFTPGPTGTVSLAVTVTNGANSSANAMVTPAIIPAPVATVSAPTAVTAGQAGYTASVPAQSGCTYAWTVGAAVVTAGSGTNQIAFTPAGSGSVTFSVVVTNALNSASAPGTASSAIVAAPAIASFSASPSSIATGAGTTLAYAFTGGNGVIDHSVGSVTSGGSSPVSPAATTTYTLLVTNTAGTSVTAPATVTVLSGPAPAITAFTGNPTTITLGQGTILAFTFSNGTGSIDHGVGAVTSSGSFAVSPRATTTYTLTVTGADNTTTTAQVTVSVMQFVSKWLYVANDFDGSVSGFSVDDTTGLLTSLGADVSMGGQGNSCRTITSDPRCRFVFCTDFSDNLVSSFLIDQASGTLTLTSGSPLTTDNYPWGCVVDPTGSFLYVSCDGVVDAFTINQANGALTPLGQYGVLSGPGAFKGSGMKRGYFPNSGGIAVHPSGAWLFTACQYSNKLDVFALDPATGVLSVDTEYPLTTKLDGPIGVAVNPTGAYVAIKGEAGTSCVDTFNFNILTGALSNPIESTPLIGSNAFNGLCFSPTMNVLYTAFYGVSGNPVPTVDAWTIDLTSGVLTALNGGGCTWFNPTDGADNIMVTRNGKWAYATNYDYDNIAFGPVNQTTGALSATAINYPTGGNPDDIVIAGVLEPIPQ